eukprot:13101422-Alexandrium_andersonii.AAC.1
MAEGLGHKPAASVGFAVKGPFNFAVFPPLIWLLKRARPDLEIHALAGNVPEIGEPRRAAMNK